MCDFSFGYEVYPLSIMIIFAKGPEEEHRQLRTCPPTQTAANLLAFLWIGCPDLGCPHNREEQFGKNP